ncbi:protein-disulfide reductase DsbD family protein [Thermomonas fusca]|uniref:Cytochrome C biogenesis protein n=1 Tax=Thermomonas fusca TaxID=215690 RepID=A0A5R9PJS3_9GAMM|nr:protein-disulfide reductase DsbD [Thermomonas fusca]TLX22988.1 cytochrome C biogenesis protein [Thermomonas fusca]
MTGFTLRLRRWLAAPALIASLLAATPAIAADFELPPVDEVFVLSAQATARNRIEVRWKIADGYYLYRHRTSVKAGAGFAEPRLALPDGNKHRDEFFGDVETYRTQLVGVVTGVPAASATGVALTVKYQGCADAGICYPPQTRTLTVALPQADAGDDFLPGRKSGGGLFGLGNRGAAVDAAPLPAAQAFGSELIALDGDTLLLRLTPARGYYLYRDKLSVQLEGASGLSVKLPPPAKLPAATPYRDEHFGDVAVYFDQVEIALPVARSTTRAAGGTLVLGLQGCQDNGICYPPMTRRLAFSLPAGTLATVTDNTVSGSSGPAGPLPVQGAAPADAPLSAATTAGTALATTAAVEATSGTTVVDGTPQPAREPPPQRRTPGLLAALLLALGGGLILNLMPCVLPVLSLKALSLAQSGAGRGEARRHALAYTAGVLASMLALGALVLALRHAGLALGWGFQLQQPLVLAGLALVMFALGLSLSGLWQANVGLGQRTGALLQGNGVRADFFTGVLAVVLATPCTAPFMGAALAYAFTGPTAGALLVFLMLGLGLALPFLLIGFVPAFARLLPKPGAWMETLKQLLAFPLYATAAWLVWVLAKLRGADAAGLWLAAAILLALAAWAWMRARNGGARGWQALALLALLAVGWPLARLHALPRPQANAVSAPAGIASVAWSEQALADLRAQDRPVFVNMTADWCVTCKANEKTVFARERFRVALEAANAVYMVGDYTDVDPAITAYLQRHRAVGVPLYVIYPRGGGEGRILPTLLTAGMVEDALREAAR